MASRLFGSESVMLSGTTLQHVVTQTYSLIRWEHSCRNWDVPAKNNIQLHMVNLERKIVYEHRKDEVGSVII